MAASKTPSKQYTEILLEVSNLRIHAGTLEVQLRADREPEKPRWWTAPSVGAAAAAAEFKAISEALEKNRPVYAEVSAAGGFLKISAISIHYSDTNR